MSKLLLNPGPTNTRLSTKIAQWLGSDVCHRTDEFYDTMHATKRLLLDMVSFKAKDTFHVALFGGSGTAAMEAMISSLIPCHEPVVVINAGKYGLRAMKMMNIYGIPFREVISSNIDRSRSVHRRPQASTRSL